MALLVVLGLVALCVAAVTLPGRRRRVDAARWWRAINTLRDGTAPTVPCEVPDPYGEPEHVRVLRPRGGRPDGQVPPARVPAARVPAARRPPDARDRRCL
jgi:hypothetical protein